MFSPLAGWRSTRSRQNRFRPAGPALGPEAVSGLDQGDTGATPTATRGNGSAGRGHGSDTVGTRSVPAASGGTPAGLPVSGWYGLLRAAHHDAYCPCTNRRTNTGCRGELVSLQEHGFCRVWPGGEIGRRTGLKILCPVKGRAGSSPAPATCILPGFIGSSSG